MSMLKRLLGSLHTAVFDTSADSGLAFFIRHSDGVQWAVGDEQLTATVNGYSKTYQLAPLTLGQLAGQLVIDGFDVSGLNPEFSGLSASVLLDGAGNSRNSNGDRLFAFRDLLRSLFGGYARELREAKQQGQEAIRQMVITQSEAEWLDLWGALYNTPRPAGMAEADYQKLIPAEAFRLRVNGLAIEQAIEDLTGQVVHIEEPWIDMFRLDNSRLSSLAKFYDGSTVGPHLIRPVADGSIDWTGILDIIARNKAAGVLVLPPEVRNRTWLNDPLAGIIWTERMDMMSELLKYSDIPRLSETLYLSNTRIDRNYSAAITSLQMISGLKDSLMNQVWFGPSRLLGYYAELPHDQKIMQLFTGYNKPPLIEAYPTTRKTWRDGGKWSGRQSWAKPYEWKVYYRSTSYGRGAIVEAPVNGAMWFDQASGADWTVPKSWNQMSWQGLREAEANDGYPSWGTNGQADWDESTWQDASETTWQADRSWEDEDSDWTT